MRYLLDDALLPTQRLTRRAPKTTDRYERPGGTSIAPGVVPIQAEDVTDTVPATRYVLTEAAERMTDTPIAT